MLTHAVRRGNKEVNKEESKTTEPGKDTPQIAERVLDAVDCTARSSSLVDSNMPVSIGNIITPVDCESPETSNILLDVPVPRTCQLMSS